MPEGYSQICQTDYTCFAYEDGYYYYRSAADHMYLYRADEQGENRERLAKCSGQYHYRSMRNMGKNIIGLSCSTRMMYKYLHYSTIVLTWKIVIYMK